MAQPSPGKGAPKVADRPLKLEKLWEMYELTMQTVVITGGAGILGGEIAFLADVGMCFRCHIRFRF
jgi:hypothetical protein